jgi:hypothetical protein
MNAHHTLGNSQIKFPKHTDEMVPMMGTHHVFHLNELDTPTYYFQTSTRTSVIDLAFTLQVINDSLFNSAVDDGASTGSSHATIWFDIVAALIMVTTNSNIIRYHWNKTDWDILSKNSQYTLPCLMNGLATPP